MLNSHTVEMAKSIPPGIGNNSLFPILQTSLKKSLYVKEDLINKYNKFLWRLL